ncbi:hypothetical protein EV128_12324 [Rhizobium azibense]|nr:hypothetical protein EV128_12324 [Rhizobium azibense]
MVAALMREDMINNLTDPRHRLHARFPAAAPFCDLGNSENFRSLVCERGPFSAFSRRPTSLSLQPEASSLLRLDLGASASLGDGKDLKLLITYIDYVSNSFAH